MINRQGVVCAVLGCGVALLVGCGSDKPTNFIGPNANGGASATGNRAGAGGRDGAAGATGKSGSSGSGGTDAASPLAPVIEITNPIGATSANAGPVLVEDQITALCSVKSSTAPGATRVDPSSVKIELLDADGNSLKSAAGTPTTHDSVYSATFVISAVPSGVVSFGCSASDTAMPAHTASATLETLVDRGPEITIGDPQDKSPHNLLGPMNVEFTAVASPITEADDQAGVSGVTLSVGGVTIPTVEKKKGSYQASVDFTDKSLFNAPP